MLFMDKGEAGDTARRAREPLHRDC